MESIQAIKSRISGIASTRQITQSMRLVSTAKVQRCRDRMEQNRMFRDSAEELRRQLTAAFPDSRHPFLTGNGSKTAAVILISGDRGLCGGYNIGVCKQALSLIEELGGCKLIAVGAKGGDYLKRRRKKADSSFTGVSETPFFEDAWDIARVALDWYQNGEVGAVHLVYTRFRSLLSQNPAVEQLLPIAPGQDRFIPLVEPDSSGFVEQAATFCVASQVFGAMLESAACEQSARITSMDAAVKNSDEMIASLTTRYNQARQGAITQEITEIVSGADALLQGEE